MNNAVYVGIELGGTKTLCTVASSFDDPIDFLRIVTTSADETLSEIANFIKKFDVISGIGIASFGPINLDINSSRFGVMENTPKPGWKNASIYSFFKNTFSCPVSIDTDVNAAGLAEYHRGAGIGLKNFIYLTVGTGIGGGAILNGSPVKGLSHPEMGHLALPRVTGDEAFTCACPFHASCVEGLASGTAVSARWGAPLNELPTNHPSWDMEAEYLAELGHTLTLTYSPQKIILGGGVVSEDLLIKVRQKLLVKLNGYVYALNQKGALDHYICMPKLGDQAGPIGSLLLALPSTKTNTQANQPLGSLR